MLKRLLFALPLLISAQCLAQITFVDSSLTWEQLSRQAKKEKKLIFLHIEGEGCEQCNEVAAKGFSSPILKERFDKSFVSSKVRIESKNGANLANKFGLSHPLVSLFLTADGNVLNRFNGSTSNSEIYLQNADLALNRMSRKPLETLDKEYESGERSAKFLRNYIQRRRELGNPVDKLLDEYAGKLSIDSLTNYETIKFIYESGPTLDSRIYKAVQVVAPAKMIDSLYKSVSYREAMAINNGIISNSFHKAVQTKDQKLAYLVSNFTYRSHLPDHEMANLAQQRKMLQYNYAVKDTMSYIQQASSLLNYNHLVISSDSLRRMDEAYFKKMSKVNDSSNEKIVPNGVGFPPPSHYFNVELNEHAWHVYEMSDKKGELERALIWSKRSLEWFDELNKGRNHPMRLGNPAFLDTYAHLLYKLGRKEEAIEWQTKAVEAGKAAKQLSPDIESALTKMKAGTL
ncbi:hypothetical protein [Dyadobacter sp. CY312]|uniref:hypothetical protein n=1 Tax=Dyadobacter sp. CY312 TaxID=2907303 RepID=UPI001F349571|nr:hypothetical protein [Dyadobacter sp. CY312]MCE7040096.1 hypothetical protein [Dyadobacter sp. CY312]